MNVAQTARAREGWGTGDLPVEGSKYDRESLRLCFMGRGNT